MLKVYEWQIGSFSGQISAGNIKTATTKAIRNYINFVPYYGTEIARVEILIKLVK